MSKNPKQFVEVWTNGEFLFSQPAGEPLIFDYNVSFEGKTFLLLFTDKERNEQEKTEKDEIGQFLSDL